MTGCNPLSLLKRRKKRQSIRPVPIEIRTHGPNHADIWRVAMLSCDLKSDTSLISQNLVTNVLGAHIHPFDKETTMQGAGRINTSEADGYVDLVWCFENNSNRMHNTRFTVTSCHDAPYDAVLGKGDAEHYGMTGSKKRR
ncbi:hypothetical protein FB567DRAFT_538542 [Paraphoma chrysanthemicola]|uniref:Uncharacterized protein n=1 Tax=Paraphoma chrysanthemicola TaxID=798071 RepID=A0A8K0VSS4_9PLEO|nr:hypothetical protein FB567DRAFT_538542 [Paraphoma chrysanthemicola]